MLKLKIVFKNNRLISIILTSLSFVLFCYLIYKSEIVYASTKRDFYSKYLIISILLIIFSVFSFTINNEIKKNIITVLFSSILTFYFVEIILFFYLNSFNRYDILQKIKSKNLNPVISISPNIFLLKKENTIMPFSGISDMLTIHCNENGYFSKYQSDRYGFNNLDKFWDNKKIDFVLIGDSFVQGRCVNFIDTIAGNIQKKNKTVLSLGMDGTGPLIQYATLKEYIKFKDIKNILYFYFEGNDLFDLKDEFDNDLLKNYFINNNYQQNLILKQTTINQILKKEIEKSLEIEEDKSYLKKIMKLSNLRTLTINLLFPVSLETPEISIENLKIFEKILLKKKEFSKDIGADFYFIYLPEHERFTNNNNNDFFNAKNEILNIVEKHNINYIDIVEVLFNKINDPLSMFSFRQASHYNEKGYNLLVNEIFKFFEF